MGNIIATASGLAPSDYHFLALMGHALAAQYFIDFEEINE